MSADPQCPECQGSGLNRAGAFCEVCQIKPRGIFRDVRAIAEGMIQERVFGMLGLDKVAELFGEGSPAHVEARRLLEANRAAREAALYPPEWLFKVWAMVDNPAGSGVTWKPEKRIIPGKNAIGVQVDVIATSPEHARGLVADVFREAGHARWLVTRIQRRDAETESAREIVREALERARLGT